jgi:hypothetical protein
MRQTFRHGLFATAKAALFRFEDEAPAFVQVDAPDFHCAVRPPSLDAALKHIVVEVMRG